MRCSGCTGLSILFHMKHASLYQGIFLFSFVANSDSCDILWYTSRYHRHYFHHRSNDIVTFLTPAKEIEVSHFHCVEYLNNHYVQENSLQKHPPKRCQIEVVE